MNEKSAMYNGNRLERKFKELKQKEEKAFLPFVVLGDPDYETSLEVLRTLIKNGADVLELGFPFSDPIADGPTIQKADQRALKNGGNTDKAFKLLEEIKKESDVPVCLLLYYNIVYAYGLERFYKRAKEAGVDAILIPDVSFEESQPVLDTADKYGIDTVFLLSSSTPKERMERIIEKCKGFAYLLAIAGTTGAREKIQETAFELIEKSRALTDKPLCLGFGISKPEHVTALKETNVDGIIVGSAIVKIIERNIEDKKKMLEEIGNHVREMKEATK